MLPDGLLNNFRPRQVGILITICRKTKVLTPDDRGFSCTRLQTECFYPLMQGSCAARIKGTFHSYPEYISVKP
jgi:hypothetical protein